MRTDAWRGIALAMAVVLLSACSPGGSPDGGAWEPDVIAARESAGIAGCPSAPRSTPLADVPALELPCLGAEGSVDLALLEGPYVLNLWASWCGPCREELPLLAELAEREGAQVIGIAYDDADLLKAISLAESAAVTYPSLVDADTRLREPLGVIGLPQTVFVDADGLVAIERRAYRSYDELLSDYRRHLGMDS